MNGFIHRQPLSLGRLPHGVPLVGSHGSYRSIYRMTTRALRMARARWFVACGIAHRVGLAAQEKMVMDKENDLSSRLESQREINAQKVYAVSALEGRTASLAGRGGCCYPFGPIHATYPHRPTAARPSWCAGDC